MKLLKINVEDVSAIHVAISLSQIFLKACDIRQTISLLPCISFLKTTMKNGHFSQLFYKTATFPFHYYGYTFLIYVPHLTRYLFSYC
jgi:hypothetical protein